jgi:tellurite resistance protein TehA-like permease
MVCLIIWRSFIAMRSPILLKELLTSMQCRFAICMNAGIIGVLMHQLPYQFRGLSNVLSNIAYLVDLILFAVFSVIVLLRLILYPKSTVKVSTSSAEELCYFSCIPIALLTIAELTALQVSTAFWGGHAFSLVAYVLWWIGCGMMVTLGVMIYIVLFRKPMVEDRSAPTALFIPAVGTATVATSGGLITMYAYNLSARLSVPVIIVSYLVVGQGIFLALLVYAFFTHRLMVTGWPQAPKIPSLALLVGPMGQSATALQLLGTAANTGQKFSGYHKGTFLQSNPAMALDAASILISMLLFGFGVFWICIFVWALLEFAWKRQHTFTMTWWSTIFPIGKNRCQRT